MPHFVGKVTQKALIFHNGNVLLNRDVGNETYDLPGGRVDVGEDPTEALKRELHEELGITVEVGHAFFTTLVSWGAEKSPHYFIVFSASLIPADQDIRPDGAEVAEYRWITESELDTIDIHQECANAIRAYFALHK